MEDNKKRERREFILDETGDITTVSIVTDPAIEKAFMLFNSVKEIQKFKESSDERMEITGPAMVPNMDILRKDENGNYYDCWFSEATVKACASIYLANCNHTSANFEHTRDMFDGIHIIESWIVEDPNMDKSKALGFKDITKGTWFITYKVDSPELWSKIKESGFTGFSIEGFFNTYNSIKDQDKKLALINSILSSSMSESSKEEFIKKIIRTV